jgi:hypothetical protein
VRVSSAYSLSGLYASKTSPVVRFNRDSLELVVDERLKRPLLRVRGRVAEEAYAILAKKFLTRGDNSSEVLIPLTALPAVSTWLLASYGSKASEERLDTLLYRTPKLIADLVWDLVELSPKVSENNKPLIDHRTALKASKIVRELLKLYKLG